MMAGANQFTAKQFTDAIPGTGGFETYAPVSESRVKRFLVG